MQNSFILKCLHCFVLLFLFVKGSLLILVRLGAESFGGGRLFV